MDLFLTPDGRGARLVNEAAFGKFDEWCQKHLNARSTVPDAAVEREGIARAQERCRALAALIRFDPKRAIELTLTGKDRLRLPPSIAPLMEHRVSGRGTLAVLAALPEPGKEKQVGWHVQPARAASHWPGGMGERIEWERHVRKSSGHPSIPRGTGGSPALPRTSTSEFGLK